jgi:predicted PolB exonuclease-like 3'-5' exonuclease
MEEQIPAFRPKIKRVFWDIETSPNIGLFFKSGYDLVINPDAIIHERKVICIGYKFEGDRKVSILQWDKNQDDREMLRDFTLVANEADEMVAHFGDRFDLPWFRTRCLIHRLDPIPVYKTIDTKAWAAKHFSFNSNKLDYLSKVLGHGGKEKMEFSDWFDIVVHGCPRALKKMVHYCGKDVERLEEVYHDLAPYMKPKTHAGVLAGKARWTCPRTGSTNVAYHKKRVTAAGTVSYQFQNLDDGSYFTISEKSYNDFLNRYSAQLNAKKKKS